MSVPGGASEQRLMEILPSGTLPCNGSWRHFDADALTL